MSLFQHSVLTKHLKLQNADAIDNAYKKYVAYFHNPLVQQNIVEAKEEQFQEGFLRELFVGVLGFTINPNPDYNLTTEFKNEKGARKADGAILKDEKALAVIELKSTKTKDLENIRQQAFDYKANQSGCIYVVTSNFRKLRFYIDDAVEHEDFDLFHLNRQEFAVLYLCLSKEQILNNEPKKIKSESIAEEKEITKTFYSDYSVFKRELYLNLVKNNIDSTEYKSKLKSETGPQGIKEQKLSLFKKSQHLIDRLLFIFFAEDRGLLGPNSTLTIINDWRKLVELDAHVPLYDRFKLFFDYLDKGRSGTDKNAEVYAYNGGLFREDQILNSLSIDDELLEKHAKKLSNYDFNSQVDVNILGHIFENSLNEIEIVSEEIEGSASGEYESKRKKDGVFYTPKYITKYVVENSIGLVFSIKRLELGIVEHEYQKRKKGRKKSTLQTLKQRLDDYRDWLLKIKICDPACGSGAFLNQALDRIIEEHRYIDELETSLLGGGIVFQNIETTILESNIYGVDVNEEAVEIAKLSLWLRTAMPRRKLNDLSKNIKVGNSLIESKSVAGPKGFSWASEFPDVFDEGGFDFVIGNPPYVGEKGHAEIFEAIKSVPKWKDYYRRRSNTYYFFIKQGIDLLKDGGIQSLIVPREFTNADWANKVRRSVLGSSKIIEMVDFNKLKVFEDSGTTSFILTHQKETDEDYNFWFKSLGSTTDIQAELFNDGNRKKMNVSKLRSDDFKPWRFAEFDLAFTDSIVPIATIFQVGQGVVSGSDRITAKHVSTGLVEEAMLGRGIFVLREDVDIKIEGDDTCLKIDDKWVTLTDEDKTLIKPYYMPENLGGWHVTKTNRYLIYVGEHDISPNIEKYLLQFCSVLINRSKITDEKVTMDEFEKFTLEDIQRHYSSAGAVQKVMKRKQWYLPLYERAAIPFESHKIVVNTKNMDVFTYSDGALYSSGGGSGGQNFIYPNLKSDYIANLPEDIRLGDLVAYTCAVLNSKLVGFIINNGQFNQLSTSKIGDLPIRLVDFDDDLERVEFEKVVDLTKSLRFDSEKLASLILDFSKYIELSSGVSSAAARNWYVTEFSQFILDLNRSLKKAGAAKLAKSAEYDWMKILDDKRTEADTLRAQIRKNERTVDKVIHQLFGLTKTEMDVIAE